MKDKEYTSFRRGYKCPECSMKFYHPPDGGGYYPYPLWSYGVCPECGYSGNYEEIVGRFKIIGKNFFGKRIYGAWEDKQEERPFDKEIRISKEIFTKNKI